MQHNVTDSFRRKLPILFYNTITIPQSKGSDGYFLRVFLKSYRFAADRRKQLRLTAKTLVLLPKIWYTIQVYYN